MSDFNSITDAIGNEFGGFASDGIESADVTGYIDTGSYTLNLLLSGSIFNGLPENKITALAGEEATGKTFFALSIIKNFLKSDPRAGVILFESEGAISQDMLETRGIDTSRVYIAPVCTIEEFRTQAVKAVDKHLETPKNKRYKLMFVLDSLGMLSTGKEMQDTADGKTTRDMTRAPLIRSAFRVLTLKLGRAGVPLLLTNHVYDAIGSLFPSKKVAGGGGLKYAASTIVTLGKSKEKSGGDIVGSKIRLKVPKARLTRENMEVTTLLNYSTGLNRKTILSDPEKYFTEDILKEIDKHSSKDFLYGSDFYDQETSKEIKSE